MRGSHPSRQASIVDYTVNNPSQPSNTKVSGGTVSEENGKKDIDTLEDKSFAKNIGSENLDTNRMKCEPNLTGKCVVHNCAMRQIRVTTKKWRHRGKGRGFGYINVKVTHFICSDAQIS